MLRKHQIHVEEVRLGRQTVRKEADKESPGSPFTSDVSGIKDATERISREDINLYFDKKSEGGGVEEIKRYVKNGILFISFGNEEIK